MSAKSLQFKPAYITWLAIALFVLLFASAASKPLELDNMDFPAVAEQTAASGVPVYYHGEEDPAALGLYHPPLYIYLLALWIRAFGFGEIQVRMFGMVCALHQGAVVIEILRALFGAQAVAQWSHWFWLVFLLNPYTLQAAAITDIDTTIYGPLLCAAFLAAIRISWRDGEWRRDPVSKAEYLLAAAVLTLCLWAKLTTVLLVFPFIFFLLIPRLSVRRAAATAGAIVGLGTAGFLITYYAYGKLTGLDIDFTFAFTWASFLNRGSSGRAGLAARLADFRNNARMMVPFMVVWTGLLPWVAGLCALVFAVRRAFRNRDPRAAHYALLIAAALLGTGYYCGKVGTFGAAPFKYVFVFWGLVLTSPVLLTFGALTAKDFRVAAPEQVSRRATGLAATFLFALGAFLAATRIQDHLIAGPITILNKWAALGPGLAVLAGAATIRFRHIGSVLLICSFGLYCGVESGIGLYESRAEYATTYEYGQTGFMDTVAFLRLNTGPNDIIVSMKDIGFRAHRRYYENYSALYGDRAAEDRLTAAVASGKIAYLVFTEGHGEDQLAMKPSLLKWVAEHCQLVRSFGNYRVYKYRGATPADDRR